MVRSSPVMVRGAFAIETDWLTGIAECAEVFAGACAVITTDPPLLMMAVLPLISMISGSLELYRNAAGLTVKYG